MLFDIEKAREKEKGYTSVKHMDGMGVTKLKYGVDTDLPPIHGHIPGGCSVPAANMDCSLTCWPESPLKCGLFSMTMARITSLQGYLSATSTTAGTARLVSGCTART